MPGHPLAKSAGADHAIAGPPHRLRAARLAAAVLTWIVFAGPLGWPFPAAAAAMESAILVQAVAPIRPVLGADGRVHLVYELLLVNPSSLTLTVTALAVLDGGGSGTALQNLAGDDLAAVLRISLFGGALQPSQSAIVFVDATVAGDAPVPRTVRHRLTIAQATPSQPGTADLGGLTIAPQVGVAPNLTFVTPPVVVDRTPAMVLAPPVRGRNWVMFRSCCAVSTSHRAGAAAYDGTLFIAERFAIDFVQIDADARLIVGPGNEPRSYRHYGAPVFAVAEGVVASARDTEPDQVPRALPEGMSAASHFHVIDRASPLAADGLPFVFSAFTGQGLLAADALALGLRGLPAPIEREGLAGPHQNRLPLNHQLVDFEP